MNEDEVQADSRFHVTREAREMDTHHIRQRTFFQRLEYFRGISGGQKKLGRQGIHAVYSLVNKIHVMLDY